MHISKMACRLISAATLTIVSTASARAEENTAPIVGSVESAAATMEDQGIIVKKSRAETAVFGKRPFMRSPRISPDGTKLAVMMSRDGVDNLGWLDLNQPGSAPNFFVKAEEFREAGDRTVQSWFWVGNRTIVIELFSREIINGRRGDLGRLAAYDIETKKTTPLAWENAGADATDVPYINDKNEIIYIERDTIKDGDYKGNPEIVEVNVRTGKLRIVQRPNVEVTGWFVDGKGVVRAGAGGDGDSGKQRLLYRSNEKGTFKTVQNMSDPTFTGAQIYPSVFLDEPDMAYATSNKDGFRKVYKINMKTMEIVGEPIFGLKSYDVDGIISNKANRDMIGVGYTTTRSRTRWFEGRRAEVQKLLEEQFGKNNVQIVSNNDEITKLVVYVAKAHQAGTYYVFDTTTGKLGILGNYHPILKD